MCVTYAVAPKTFKALPTGGHAHTPHACPPHLLYSLLPTSTKTPYERDTQLFTVEDSQSC
jgi:hypothetical protein